MNDDEFNIPRGIDFFDDDEDDELVQVNHLVPKSVKDDAHDAAEHGELSDAVRDAYRIVAYGGEVAGSHRLEQELKHVGYEKKHVERQLTSLQERLADIERRESEIQDRIESVESSSERFETALNELESQLREGMNVFPSHGLVQEVADAGSKTPEEVIELLKERNPEIPDHAFVDQRSADKAWLGLDS